jgi:hypothetical protein
VGVAAAGTPPARRWRGAAPTVRRTPSEFNGETLPDFVQPLFKRVKSGVNGLIVKVENIAARESPENPVVAFHVDQHLFNRVTRGGNYAEQNFHRDPRLGEMESQPGKIYAR